MHSLRGQDLRPDLMVGYRISVSISMPSELYGSIREVATRERTKVGPTITDLLIFGLEYKDMLEEDRRLVATKPAPTKPRKKAKPKTPSKKSKK